MAHIIIFVNAAGAEQYLQQWDAMEHRPMGGSEASALRLADALQKLGHRVAVTNRLEDLYQGCDVFIATRVWQLFGRGIRPGRLCYLWCTDDADQPGVRDLTNPELAAKTYATADAVVVLSQYQAQRWAALLHLPADKTCHLPYGVPLSRFSPAPAAERRPWAYYASTPFRGLEQLVRTWPRIRARAPAAELHVFSSMQIYGAADPQEYQRWYEAARALPGVHYHGAQPQPTIRATSRLCRALAYPCTFPETSCLAAMEAMAAGCAVVATTLGSLPETAVGNPLVPPGPAWLEAWEHEVVRALTDDAHYASLARHNLTVSADRDWSAVARLWVDRFALDAARRKLARFGA